MKKLLLTLATVAMCGFASYAADVTLQVKDATDIKGTLNEEVAPSADNQYGSGKNYKPLESLKLGDYTFTFALTEKESAPAYYYPMSTSPDGATTIRLYGGKSKAAGNKMTVKCPAGKTMKSFTLDCSQAEVGAEVNASVGTATTASKKVVWTNTEAVSEVTLTIHVQTRFTAITISDEEAGVTPPPAGGDITVKKATEVAAGEVAFVFDNNDFKGYVETFEYNEAKPYGYWMAVAATPADEMKVTEKAIFTLAKTDKGYTIKDCNGYFMGWDGTHFSFNAYKTSDEGHCYWNASMVDGSVKIVNVDKYVDKDQKECDVYLAGKKYNSDYEMCLTSYENNPLPMLYVKGGGSGVADIAVENNGEAVYYNLQGVRVENPVKGLYIVVKGGKSQKVIL